MITTRCYRNNDRLQMSFTSDVRAHLRLEPGHLIGVTLGPGNTVQLINATRVLEATVKEKVPA